MLITDSDQVQNLPITPIRFDDQCYKAVVVYYTTTHLSEPC